MLETDQKLLQKKKNGALKDYAMTIHNQASFYLLNGEVDKVEIKLSRSNRNFHGNGQ